MEESHHVPSNLPPAEVVTEVTEVSLNSLMKIIMTFLRFPCFIIFRDLGDNQVTKDNILTLFRLI